MLYKHTKPYRVWHTPQMLPANHVQVLQYPALISSAEQIHAWPPGLVWLCIVQTFEWRTREFTTFVKLNLNHGPQPMVTKNTELYLSLNLSAATSYPIIYPIPLSFLVGSLKHISTIYSTVVKINLSILAFLNVVC